MFKLRDDMAEGPPQCGYGSVGLCCSLCMLGPCRINPFARETEKGRCGMDADRIVAARLLQMIVAEAGCALNELSVSARALEGWTGSAATADDRLLNFLAQKYVLDDHAPEWVASALSRRSELFLTANCDDAGVSQCLGALVPGKDFSALLYDESWSSPPLFMIAQGLSSLRAQETPVDAAYLQCCQLSLIKLAAKELICDINSLTQGESRPGPLAETREIIGRSPKTSGPAPLIILRETKLYIPGEDEKNDSPQDSHMLTDVHDLLALAWNYHKKWDACHPVGKQHRGNRNFRF